ncbi:MAG: TonB-dependent receptor [Chryseobacterium sp.]|uniref:TonB-dependent receptor n=1 Tax=Chryseobacterium sp. TaxID=1871047 RepID=UPI0025B93333|nr:TonB-dependent receptor [Chryseobacterium sp.]MCJ7934891.1 TonB-dependent receptor [Chryseobacterium sp.]
MMRGSIAFFLIIFFQLSYAQFSIAGNITDQENKPLEFVRISLVNSSQKSWVAVSNTSGQYQFQNLEKGNYRLTFNYPVYEKDTAISVALAKDAVVNLRLNITKNISEVKIEGNRSLIESKADRLRFNVGNSDLTKGNNVWEVLEKTPLVTASTDGNIQIAGTSNAIVYINEKRKQLSGTALKSYLSGLPSENLEAVEVMTTPSSKYEAEGGAGIINIVLKKSKNDGMTGSWVLSTRQTRVNSQSSSANFNYRKGKWSAYSSMYYGARNRKPDARKEIIYPEGYSLQKREINSNDNNENQFGGVNLGIDYEINAKNTVGILFDYSGAWDEESREARSHDFYAGRDSLSLTSNSNKLRSNTYSLNANYVAKLDSIGKRFSVDYDALFYDSSNNSLVETILLAPVGAGNTFRSSSPQNVRNQSLKVDFEWPFNKEVSMDFGGKMSFSKINNELLFENNTADGSWVKDGTRSNDFRYEENIYALYATLNHTVNKKWSYQVGARLENTLANGWLENIKAVNRNYISLFPTAFLRYVNDKGNSFNLALSSRITRPSFWDVNPFRTYLTDQTYFEGNPFLQPSRYYRQEMSHTVKKKKSTYVFQLAASQTIDEFYALPYNPSGNVIVNKRVNYGDKYGYTGSIVYYGQILPWWKITTSVLTGYVVSKGEYEGLPIHNKTFLLNISANQTFTISKAAGLTCTVIAANSFPATIVNTRIGNRLETEIRIRKAIGDWNITLSGQDFFRSNKDRYKVDVGDLRVYDNYYYDTRSVALAVSYAFGKKTVKEKRDRDTEFDEVKQRIK